MKFPKRYLADGTATTSRVVKVEKVPCNIHKECYRVFKAWAGQPYPAEIIAMHAYVCNDGESIGLLHAPPNETPQWKAGVRLRVKNLRKRLASDSQD